MRILCFIMWFVLVAASPSGPQLDQAGRAVIHGFITAVRTNDDTAMRKAWSDLHQNTSATQYMQQYLPLHFQVFHLQGLIIQLEDIQKKYADRKAESVPAHAPEPEAAAPQLPPDNGSRVALQNNEDIVRARNNQDIVKAAVNAPFVDNRKRVLAYPNQDLPSNQDIIRARRDALLRRTAQLHQEEYDFLQAMGELP